MLGIHLANKEIVSKLSNSLQPQPVQRAKSADVLKSNSSLSGMAIVPRPNSVHTENIAFSGPENAAFSGTETDFRADASSPLESD